MDYVVIIPALDPDVSLISFVNSIITHGIKKIIIIDDGSSLKSQHVFSELIEYPEVDVLVHSVNWGKGRALKTALNHYLISYARDFIGVVTADCDGQHSVDDIVQIGRSMAFHKDALVLGSRCLSDKNVPIKSKFGNAVTSLMIKLLNGSVIHDTQTGLRGIPNAWIKNILSLPGERYEYEMEMLIEALNQKIEVLEIPIQTIYNEGNRGTHFQAIADSLSVCKVIIGRFMKFCGSSLVSFVIDYAVFYLLNGLMSQIPLGRRLPISAIVARAISSYCNFCINRHMVFQSKTRIGVELARYYLLCIIVLCISTALVYFLCSHLLWNELVVKPAIDVMLFFIGYRIQCNKIFA